MRTPLIRMRSLGSLLSCGRGASSSVRPLTPSSDVRAYESLVSSNGVRLLLISDPSADRCGAAMNAGVGSFSEDHPGIAHLLEHLLLSNSKRFPLLNGFSKFLDAHGGAYNAMTTHDATIYYFDIMPDYMSGALDMFLDSFVSPLLDARAVEAEIDAVDHEFQKNIGSDSFRMYDFVNSRMSARHPASRFSIGNEYTLRRALPAAAAAAAGSSSSSSSSRALVAAFHARHYSSNRMSLAVLGKTSLADMRALVLPLVEQIPNLNASFPEFAPADPLEGACARTLFKVEPVSDIHRLTLVFPIPDLTTHYRANPLRHIDYYLDMKHEQSLASRLQARGWGTHVTMRELLSVRGSHAISLHASLSSAGIEHYDDVIKLVFAYVQLLRTEGAQQWRLEQQRRQSRIDFDYRDKDEPAEHVARVVETMDKVDPEDVESCGVLIKTVDADLFRRVLAHLHPRRMAVFLFSKLVAADCDQVDKWYKIRFARAPIPDRQIEAWEAAAAAGAAAGAAAADDAFALPPANPYIPSNLDMSPAPTAAAAAAAAATQCLPPPPPPPPPAVLVQSERFSSWFKRESSYLQPRVVARLNMVMASRLEDLESEVASQIALLMASNRIEQRLSSAHEANYRCAVESGSHEVSVKFEGFTEKMTEFVDEALAHFFDEQPDASSSSWHRRSQFDLCREIVERRFRNLDAGSQRMQSSRELVAVQGIRGFGDPAQLRDAAARLHYDTFTKAVGGLFARAKCELIVLGDFDLPDALRLTDAARAHVERSVKAPLTPSDKALCNEFELGDRANLRRRLVNRAHPANGIHVRFRCGRTHVPSYMNAMLINEIVVEDFFDDLRTKQNLGYIAYTNQAMSKQTALISFYVQSDHPCEFVDARIETFIATIPHKLANLSELEFEQQKESLTSKILKKPDSLAEMADLYSVELENEQHMFNRRELEAAALQRVTKNDLIQFFHTFLALDAPRRSKLSVYVEPAPDVKIKGAARGHCETGSDTDSDDDDDDDPEMLFRVREAAPPDLTTIEPAIAAYIDQAQEIKDMHLWKSEQKRLDWSFKQ